MPLPPLTPNPVKPEEAIRYFRSLVPMPKAEWLKLKAKAREQAFTVAGVAQLDVVAEVWASLTEAMASGTDFKAWAEQSSERLVAQWGGSVQDPGWRLQTIFRTNLQRAYSAGRLEQATDPDVAEDRPYWMFDATLDTRTTGICKKLHGTILPADDPFWSKHTPPCHFNCRSTLITLTPEQAEQMGGVTKKPRVKAASGFGGSPSTAWKPDPGKYPRDLWKLKP